MPFIYSTKFSEPSAIKNSLKDIGYKFKNSTLPTGKDVLESLIPSNEPAQATWYSLASSQKYFNEFKALGHSWISSKIINVVSGEIFLPFAIDNCSIIRIGFFVLENNSFNPSSWSKLKYATFS